MKFYQKVRFWGGIGIAIEPFIFTSLEKDWVFIGIIISLSALLNKYQLLKIHVCLCGKEEKNPIDPTHRPVRCLLVYAVMLNMLLYLASFLARYI